MKPSIQIVIIAAPPTEPGGEPQIEMQAQGTDDPWLLREILRQVENLVVSKIREAAPVPGELPPPRSRILRIN